MIVYYVSRYSQCASEKFTGWPNDYNRGLMASWNAASVHSYPHTGSVWYDLVKNQNNGSLVNMSAAKLY